MWDGGEKGFWGLSRPNATATGFTLEACPRAWVLHEPGWKKHWDRVGTRQAGLQLRGLLHLL